MISNLLAIATRQVVPVPKLMPELADVIATISTAMAVPARIATMSFTKGMKK